MKTVVIRHRRENLAKCSLEPLQGDPRISFFTYPTDPLPRLDGYLLLKVGAPPLTPVDVAGILLIDATWRLAPAIEKALPPANYIVRSLPSHFRTAYPRRQTGCPDPDTGLASIEALFLTYHLLGHDTSHLLDSYRWRDLFLQSNSLI